MLFRSGPTVREEDAALLGGQVLDETESRMLAASSVAQFGAGMLAGDAALLGGQVLDGTESRMLAASRVAHFGAGMLGTDAGLAALSAWARVVASRVDAFYVAFDLDALDAGGDWALAMPEPNGLALETALAAVRAIAAAGPVAGFGDRKSTRLNSSHIQKSRMPSSA